jgi:hypothetical protein
VEDLIGQPSAILHYCCCCVGDGHNFLGLNTKMKKRRRRTAMYNSGYVSSYAK